MDTPFCAFGPLGAQSMVKQVVLQLLLQPCDDEMSLGVPVLFGGSAFELYMPLVFSGGVAAGDMDLIVERAGDDAGDPDRFSDLHDFMEAVRSRVRGLCSGSPWPDDELSCRVNFVSCGAYSMHIYVGRVKTVDITLMSRGRAHMWQQLFPRQTVSVFCDTVVLSLPVVSAGELWCRLHGVATGAQLPDRTPNIPPETNLAALCTALRRMSLLLAFGMLAAVNNGVKGAVDGGAVDDSGAAAVAVVFPSAVKLTSLDYIRVLIAKAAKLFKEWAPLEVQPRCWFLSLNAALFESAEAVSMVLARHAARQAAKVLPASSPASSPTSSPASSPAPKRGKSKLRLEVGMGAVAVAPSAALFAADAARRKEVAAAARRDSNRKVALSVNSAWKSMLTAAVGGFLDKADKEFRVASLTALRRVGSRVLSGQRRVQALKDVLHDAAAKRAKRAGLVRQVITGLTSIREQVAALLTAGSRFRDRVMDEVIRFDEGLMADPAAMGRTDRVNRVYAQLLHSVVSAVASSFGGATDLFPLDGVAVFAAGSLMKLPIGSTATDQAMLCRKLLVVTMRAMVRTMTRIRATAATKAALVMGRPCVPMPLFRVHDLALLSSTRGAAVKVKSPTPGEPHTVVVGNAYTMQPIWDACTSMLRGVGAETVLDDRETRTLDAYWTVMHQISNESENVCAAVEGELLHMIMGVVTAPAVHLVADAHLQLTSCGFAAKQFSAHVCSAGSVMHPLLESISHLQAMAERLR